MSSHDFTVSIPSALFVNLLSCSIFSAMAWNLARPEFLNGIILGHIGSMLYFILLYCQTFSLGDLPIKQLQYEGETYAAKGHATRFCLICTITFLSILLGGISPLGLIIGLVVPFRLYIFGKMIFFVYQNPDVIFEIQRK